jgi:hypothetical protein
MRAVADLIAVGPDRLSGVRVIGVDEHRWAPRRLGAEGFVTLIIDLTPIEDQTGPALAGAKLDLCRLRIQQQTCGDGLPCSRRHLLNVPRPLRRGVPRG